MGELVDRSNANARSSEHRELDKRKTKHEKALQQWSDKLAELHAQVPENEKADVMALRTAFIVSIKVIFNI